MFSEKRLVLLLGALSVVLLSSFAAFGEEDYDEEKFYKGPQFPGGVHATGLPNDQAWQMRQNVISSTAGYTIAKWENVGPFGIGRVWDIQIDPRNDNVLYVGAGCGSGLWKTTDGGSTFKSISQNWKSQSIGDIELAPSNPDIVWVGGGECLAGGGSILWPGAGIYKSSNAGETWEHKGLDSSFFISRVKVHPTDPNIVFVGVLGNLFSKNPQRGVYRTKDGGNTWQRVYFASDSTGCVDLAIHHKNPNRIIACIWTCYRHPYKRVYTSPECKVIKSEDGGETWSPISGFPTSLGRTNLDVCETNTDIMYINCLASGSTQSGMYKSTDGGATWARTSGQPTGNFSYYGFAFNRVCVNPKNANEVLLLGITNDRSTNGGGAFSGTSFPSSNHVDYHGIQWGYTNNSIVYCADDGGLKKCTGGIGSTLTTLGAKDVKNGGLSMAQMYGGDVSKSDEKHKVAGFQDNGTCYTLSAAITNWTDGVGGDGFHCKINPFNTNVAIGSLQHGAYYMTTNKTSWSTISIGGRKQWDCPVAFDPTNGRAYVGSQYVWTASNGSTSFVQTSTQDLTNGDHTMSGSAYIMGSVTAIAAYKGVVYAGSEDGNVWYAKNVTGSGTSWKKIRDGLKTGSEERTKYDGWITDIWIDETDETGGTAYLCVWYHRWGLDYYKPAMFKLTNFGDGGVGSADWHDINGDMPSFITTHKVVKNNNADSPVKGYLFAGTDYGMFFSPNDGVNWKWLGDEAMPIVPCKDITMRNPNNLFVMSYGRGMWKMRLDQATPYKNIKNISAKGDQIINNYPNPVVNKTNIKFKVKDNQRIILGIYDLSGRLVKMLYENNVTGNKLTTIAWDATNTNGTKVASGNYICRLMGEKVTLAKMITVKK